MEYTLDKSLLSFLERVNQPLAEIIKGLEDMKVNEIRIRAGRPISLFVSHINNSRNTNSITQEYYITQESKLTKIYEKGVVFSKEEIEKIFNAVSENSIYAYQDEIKNGYITIKGGHRVGITGKVVLESGKNGTEIKHIKDISALNIRVAGQIKGCGYKLLPYVIKNERDIYNTLIVSPPGCGKTTLLRDLTRLLSDGVTNAEIISYTASIEHTEIAKHTESIVRTEIIKNNARGINRDKIFFQGVNIGLVDERSEIAACYKGVPQNDVGRRTDVLDACPKVLGMLMLLRSMSPQIIVTDEIGGRGDGDAVRSLANAGVRLLTSAHGYSTKGTLDIRKEARELVEEGIFQRIIVLDNSRGPGTIKEVMDLEVQNGYSSAN